MKTKLFFVGFWLITLSVVCLAQTNEVPNKLKLPAILGDNMVLQRDQKVPIWGWAAPGAKVTVKFAGRTEKTIADASGRWTVRLHSMSANATPASMTISAGDTMVLTNILVGEVWVCSGQSNMEKPIGEQRGQVATINAPQELATGDQFPQIRLFKVSKVKSATPLSDLTTVLSWSQCSSNVLETSKFTAAGYFFGRKLCKDVNVPIGLIESTWGGTPIELWTPTGAYQASDKFPVLKTNHVVLGAIYNAMIVPLAPYGIRGAIWYQGEGNVKTPHSIKIYTDQMEVMISRWRQLWGEGNFPFYYVQLAPYKYSPRSNVSNLTAQSLAEMWDAQTAALRIPKTGMAVVNDTVTNFADIHPARKLEVGERLALIAEANDYHKKVISSGPTFRSVKFSREKAVVRFNFAEGLTTSDGQPPTWFQIAGPDGKFLAANAVIEGEKVILSGPEIPAPKAVRLGWNEVAEPNLRNKAGLPPRPFNTSGW